MDEAAATDRCCRAAQSRAVRRLGATKCRTSIQHRRPLPRPLVASNAFGCYGSPPGEAMLLGCPVIVSNTSSLPEVCGNAALYCDPNDDDSIANQIKNLCSDSNLRKDLIKKGMLQSKQFTWRAVALNLWNPIEKACQK